MNKKTVLFFLFLFILISSVDIAAGQTKWGITAGVNLATVAIKGEGGAKNTTQFVPRMHAGLTADIPVAADFYIQPAALYSGKGFMQKDNWFSGPDNEFKVKVSYIEIPVSFLYKPQSGKGNLLIGAGPYVGYGTGGMWEAESNVVIGDIIIEDSGDAIFKNDVNEGEFGAYLYGKPFDYGANLLAGYEFSGTFSIQLNARLGLANLQPAVDGQKRGGTRKNNSLGLAVGYKF